MKNIEQLLNKENWIKYLELADEGGITNHGKAQDIVKEIEEAINYIHCCTELKGKETHTFEDYIKENRFTHKIDYTYLDVDGNEWLEEEIKILMKPDY